MKEIDIDTYYGFITTDNAFTFENLQGLTIAKLNKIREDLVELCKKRRLSEEQNKQFAMLNTELENYDDDTGIDRTQFNAKKEQCNLYIKACIKQNQDHLSFVNTNYQSLVDSIADTRRKKVNDYMTEKLTCECGAVVCRANLSRHRLTKSHKLKSINSL